MQEPPINLAEKALYLADGERQRDRGYIVIVPARGTGPS